MDSNSTPQGKNLCSAPSSEVHLSYCMPKTHDGVKTGPDVFIYSCLQMRHHPIFLPSSDTQLALSCARKAKFVQENQLCCLSSPFDTYVSILRKTGAVTSNLLTWHFLCNHPHWLIHMRWIYQKSQHIDSLTLRTNTARTTCAWNIYLCVRVHIAFPWGLRFRAQS